MHVSWASPGRGDISWSLATCSPSLRAWRHPERKGAGHRVGCGGGAGASRHPQNDLPCLRRLLPNWGIHSSPALDINFCLHVSHRESCLMSVLGTARTGQHNFGNPHSPGSTYLPARNVGCSYSGKLDVPSRVPTSQPGSCVLWVK